MNRGTKLRSWHWLGRYPYSSSYLCYGNKITSIITFLLKGRICGWGLLWVEIRRHAKEEQISLTFGSLTCLLNSFVWTWLILELTNASHVKIIFSISVSHQNIMAISVNHKKRKKKKDKVLKLLKLLHHVKFLEYSLVNFKFLFQSSPSYCLHLT